MNIPYLNKRLPGMRPVLGGNTRVFFCCLQVRTDGSVLYQSQVGDNEDGCGPYILALCSIPTCTCFACCRRPFG